MAIRGLREKVMTRFNTKFTKGNCWRWAVFPFKAYIIAVPLTLFICECVKNVIQHNGPNAHASSYEIRGLQIRILQA
jgi:hypothetical protein